MKIRVVKWLATWRMLSYLRCEHSHDMIEMRLKYCQCMQEDLVQRHHLQVYACRALIVNAVNNASQPERKADATHIFNITRR